MEMELARIEAAAASEKQYASERQCKRHGEVRRATRNGECIECRDDNQRLWVQKSRNKLADAADELNRKRTQEKLDAIERERQQFMADHPPTA